MSATETTSLQALFDTGDLFALLTAWLPWILGIVATILAFKFGPIAFRGVIKAVRGIVSKLVRA